MVLGIGIWDDDLSLNSRWAVRTWSLFYHAHHHRSEEYGTRYVSYIQVCKYKQEGSIWIV